MTPQILHTAITGQAAGRVTSYVYKPSKISLFLRQIGHDDDDDDDDDRSVLAGPVEYLALHVLKSC